MNSQMNAPKGKQQLATLQDVARHAGISVAAAGRALGNYGRVSSQTRRLALKAARYLNYYPNRVARGMKQRSTFTVGLIVGNICNPFFSTIVRAVEATLFKHDYNLIVCDSDEDINKEMSHAQVLFQRRVDGMIVSPTASQEGIGSKAVRMISEHDVPLVLIDRLVPGVKVPAVLGDNIGGAFEATKYLLELGHKRVGIIVGRKTLGSMTARVEGYRRAMALGGVVFQESLVVDAVDVGVQGGYDAAQHLLASKCPPTAIIAMNNLLAVGVLNAVRERGLHIPRDISIIGWDDFDAASHLRTPLTVVDQPAQTMGTMAAEHLLRLMSGETVDQPLEILLRCILIRRKSCSGPGEEFRHRE
jgi:LacI family transcriptional regulator, galactose operon repressor